MSPLPQELHGAELVEQGLDGAGRQALGGPSLCSGQLSRGPAIR